MKDMRATQPPESQMRPTKAQQVAILEAWFALPDYNVAADFYAQRDRIRALPELSA